MEAWRAFAIEVHTAVLADARLRLDRTRRGSEGIRRELRLTIAHTKKLVYLLAYNCSLETYARAATEGP